MRDFDLEQQLIDARRRRYGEQAQTQAPQGRMVGGRFVAPHALEYLAAGLRGFGGIRGQQMAEDELKQLQTTRQQAVADALRGFNENMQGTPEQVIPNLTPMDDEGNPMPQAIKPAQPQNIPAAFRALSTSPDAAMRQFAQQGAMQFAQKAAEKRQAEQDRQRYLSILESTKDPQKAILAGVPRQFVVEYFEAPNIGRAEVGRTVEVTGAGGEKLIQQLDKFGQPVGTPMPAYTAPMKINTGSAIELVTPKPGQKFPVIKAPSGKIAPDSGGSGRVTAPVTTDDRTQLSNRLGIPIAERDPFANMKGPQADIFKRNLYQQADKKLNEMDEASSTARNMARDMQRFLQLQQQVNMQGPVAGRVPAFSSEAQEMDAITDKITPQMRQPGSGATSDFDAKMFRNSTVVRTKNEQANEAIGQAVILQSQNISDRAQFMRDYLTVNGHLDGADRQWSRYLNSNPIFDTKSPDVPRLNPKRIPYQQFFGNANSRPDQATPPNELFNAADAILNKGKK